MGTEELDKYLDFAGVGVEYRNKEYNLKNLGLENLREELAKKRAFYTEKSQAVGVWIQPDLGTSLTRSRRVFYALIKEAAIFRYAVRFMEMDEIEELCNPKNDIDAMARDVADSYHFLFIPAFASNFPPPWNPDYRQDKVERFLRRLMDHGAAFIFYAREEDVVRWYSEAFVEYLKESVRFRRLPIGD